MPQTSKNNSRKPPVTDARREPVPEPRPVSPAHAGEIGWLPDFVYTGEKFEPGMAFFADGLGRITRFSREPADLAAARKLPGQAALPGLVNVHSMSWQRALRGRAEQPGRDTADPTAAWTAACRALSGRMNPQDIYEAARMAFTEMLLSGITCVGEFHELQRRGDGMPWPEIEYSAEPVLRAAHEVGMRISLFNVAMLRSGFGQPLGSAAPQSGTAAIDEFLRDTDALRRTVAEKYPADEAWVGVAPESIATVPADALKAIANFAHGERLRVQMRLAHDAAEIESCQAEYRRSPAAFLSEQGLIDKRFTALHGSHLGDEDCRVLGAARAAVCACPGTEQNLAMRSAPTDRILGAGAAMVLGTATAMQCDLLREARQLEYGLRVAQHKRPAVSPDVAKTLLHAATFAGARSLGATGGALEVGRPADFFTVNIYDPSIAGSDADTLLANTVFALERRAVREVWIGARQRIVNGRHPEQGLIVGRFVEMQRRLWGE